MDSCQLLSSMVQAEPNWANEFSVIHSSSYIEGLRFVRTICNEKSFLCDYNLLLGINST